MEPHPGHACAGQYTVEINGKSVLLEMGREDVVKVEMQLIL